MGRSRFLSSRVPGTVGSTNSMNFMTDLAPLLGGVLDEGRTSCSAWPSCVPALAPPAAATVPRTAWLVNNATQGRFGHRGSATSRATPLLHALRPRAPCASFCRLAALPRSGPRVFRPAYRFSIDKPETTWDEPRCGERGSRREGVGLGRTSAEGERGGVPRRRGAAPTGEGAAARGTGCRDTPDGQWSAGPRVVVMSRCWLAVTGWVGRRTLPETPEPSGPPHERS